MPAQEAAPAPARPGRWAADVSWLGLAGALAAIVPLTALGIEFLADPPDAGRWIAVLPLGVAAVYLPAAWASVTPTARRRAVQRGVVAASILIVLAGLPFFGAGIAVLLAVPTALLAIASGLVFGR